MEEIKNSIAKMYKNGILFQKIEEILELDRNFIFDILQKEKLLYRLNKEDASVLRILDIDFDDEFEKSISSIDIIYGYKDKKMYEKPYYV